MDLNYTQYYPLLEKYQSLWPNHSNTKGAVASGKKLEMWFLIEKAMLEGSLEELRNRKPSKKAEDTDKEKTVGADQEEQGQPSENVDENNEDEHVSDGGFFEE